MDKNSEKDLVEFNTDINQLQYINFKLAAMGKPYFLQPENRLWSRGRGKQ